MSNWNFEHATGAANLVSFLQLEVVAEHHRADVVFLEIEGEGGDLLTRLRGGDLEHLAGHRLLEPVDAGDAVLYLEDGPDFLDIELVEVRRLDLAEEYVLDFAGAKDRFSGHVFCALKPGLAGAKNCPAGRGILACEIYHKLLSGATSGHLEVLGRK